MTELLNNNNVQQEAYSTNVVPLPKGKGVASRFGTDSTGSFAILGSRKNLLLIDLNKLTTRTIRRQSKWEVACVKWNRTSQRSSWFATAANTDTFIWDISNSSSPCLARISSHQRAVSDLEWCWADANLLSTCSADSYVHLWDVRNPRNSLKLKSFATYTTGANHVRWNRFNRLLLASSHSGEVRIWDIRKESEPVALITAHMSKISGMDFSHNVANALLTCSHDKTVKIWDIESPRDSIAVIQHGVAVGEASFTPFGSGIVMASQRGENNNVLLWNRYELTRPVHIFTGHRDTVIEMDWRCRRDQDATAGAEYDLLTWSKDQELRMWTVDERVRTLCGESAASSADLSNAQRQREWSSPPREAESSVDEQTPRLQTQDEHVNSYSAPVARGTSEELSMLPNLNIPGVTIENINFLSRSFYVSAASSNATCMVQLRITLPALYPNAPPMFELVHSAAIDIQSQARVLQRLTEEAQSCLKSKKGCLQPCLLILQSAVDDAARSTVARQGGGLGLSDADSAAASGEHQAQAPAATGNAENLEVNLPCPRISGACFGPDGKIAFFHNFNAPLSSECRTFNDLKACYAAGTHVQAVPSMATGSTSSAEASSTSSVGFDLDDYFRASIPGSNRRRKQQHAVSGGVLPSDMTRAFWAALPSDTSKNMNKRVTLYDCSEFMPVNLQLARHYLLSTADVLGGAHQLCVHNSRVAREHSSRADVQLMWDILVSLTADFDRVPPPVALSEPLPSTSSFDPYMGIGHMPFDLHPFGRTLLRRFAQHFQLMHDDQSLAMLWAMCTLHSWESVSDDVDLEQLQGQGSKAIAGAAAAVHSSALASGRNSSLDLEFSHHALDATPGDPEQQQVASKANTIASIAEDHTGVDAQQSMPPTPQLKNLKRMTAAATTAKRRSVLFSTAAVHREQNSDKWTSGSSRQLEKRAGTQALDGQGMITISPLAFAGASLLDASDDSINMSPASLTGCVSLLDPLTSLACQASCRVYVEMLSRWTFVNQRALLKRMKVPPSFLSVPQQSLDYENHAVPATLTFGVVCSRCSRSLDKVAICPHCNSVAMNCTLCRLPVRGISSFCPVCGHGGHARHWIEWFRTEVTCPSGCGCSCAGEIAQKRPSAAASAAGSAGAAGGGAGVSPIVK